MCTIALSLLIDPKIIFFTVEGQSFIYSLAYDSWFYSLRPTAVILTLTFVVGESHILFFQFNLSFLCLKEHLTLGWDLWLTWQGNFGQVTKKKKRASCGAKQTLLKHVCALPGSLSKTQTTGIHPRISDSGNLSGARQFASSQAMLRLWSGAGMWEPRTLVYNEQPRSWVDRGQVNWPFWVYFFIYKTCTLQIRFKGNN